MPREGTADATARNGRRYSKERPTLQQGTANATARSGQRYSKERTTPREGFRIARLSRNRSTTSQRSLLVLGTQEVVDSLDGVEG
ncbi:MAG: hypothetical protein IJT11_06030 [Bacteroidaceae bacterium]|nr:hypothetical protein [Bacteroidaceae bacterium]